MVVLRRFIFHFVLYSTFVRLFSLFVSSFLLISIPPPAPILVFAPLSLRSLHYPCARSIIVAVASATSSFLLFAILCHLRRSFALLAALPRLAPLDLGTLFLLCISFLSTLLPLSSHTIHNIAIRTAALSSRSLLAMPQSFTPIQDTRITNDGISPHINPASYGAASGFRG
ncbi:hypothetical protein C8J56DRAFT_1061378 [Mycena floridula]|nr:hypothetical protein C8J56DRAFT_1061378 [Mycena floridula]